MGLDPRYVLLQGIEQYFVDKDTGLPLANGEVWFWTDNNRNSLKYVYELTGGPPNYTYSALPNPIRLSAVGTVQDANGDNKAIYYLPYSNVNPNDIELYYISVFRDGEGPNGVPQFTREAWPNITSADNPATEGESSSNNELSNSQFVDVLFDPTNVMTVAYAGSGTTTAAIAPGWFVEIQHTASGNVVITRSNRTGGAPNATPTNAPYTLSVQGNANITSLSIVQRLYHNPSIWSPITPNQQDSWINAGILLGPNTQNLRILYRPSNYAAVANTQTLLTANNITGNYNYFSNTVQLLPGDNTDLSTVGYTDIVISLTPNTTSTFSSVQVLGVSADVIVPYEQQPVNRQEDFLAHYYKPQLAYKPIPSYLVGWDFPMNPSQFYANGTRAAQAIGANKSEYKWDQTLVFQSANSGVGITRGDLGEIVLTAAATSQFALVQYIEPQAAKSLLAGKMAVNINATSNVGGGALATVALYWTDEANLPNAAAGTNNSLVLTLDANGKPATFNGAWSEIARSSLGDAECTIIDAADESFLNYGFRGWDVADNTDIDTATYMAIVVGFESITMGGTVSINSISLCKGDIATEPAPKTLAETAIDCQRYYWKTFNTNTTPAQNIGVNTGEYRYSVSQADAGDNYSPSIIFPANMRAIPAITFYNPAAANALVRNLSAPGDSAATNTTDCNLSPGSFNIHATGVGGWTVGSRLAVHATADARLGIVN